METPTIAQTQRILVELDVLLDTRIATVSRVDADAAVTLISKPYLKRRSDEFSKLIPGFSDAAYQAAYATRDADTLARSRPTQSLEGLSKLVTQLETQLLDGDPTVSSVGVDINIYPYVLTDDECQGIANAVAHYCGQFSAIRCVNIPYRDLTFQRIRQEDWSAIFLYNFKDWIAESFTNYGNTQPMGTPAVTMFIPQLVVQLDDYNDEGNRRLPNGRFVDPFDATRVAFSAFVGIEFLPAEAFSIYMPPDADL